MHKLGVGIAAIVTSGEGVQGEERAIGRHLECRAGAVCRAIKTAIHTLHQPGIRAAPLGIKRNQRGKRAISGHFEYCADIIRSS